MLIAPPAVHIALLRDDHTVGQPHGDLRDLFVGEYLDLLGVADMFLPAEAEAVVVSLTPGVQDKPRSRHTALTAIECYHKYSNKRIIYLIIILIDFIRHFQLEWNEQECVLAYMCYVVPIYNQIKYKKYIII